MALTRRSHYRIQVRLPNPDMGWRIPALTWIGEECWGFRLFLTRVEAAKLGPVLSAETRPYTPDSKT